MGGECQAIRAYCVDMCRFGNDFDVDNCEIRDCPLWEYKGLSLNSDKNQTQKKNERLLKVTNRRPLTDITDDEKLALMEMSLDDIKLPRLSEEYTERRRKYILKRYEENPLPKWSNRTNRYIWAGVISFKSVRDGSTVYKDNFKIPNKEKSKTSFIYDKDEIYVAYARDQFIKLIFPEEEWYCWQFNNIESHYPDRIPEYQKKLEEFLSDDQYYYRLKRYKLRVRKERLLNLANCYNSKATLEPMWYINYENNMLVYGGPEEFKKDIENRT